jgi:hypothetical protein
MAGPTKIEGNAKINGFSNGGSQREQMTLARPRIHKRFD